MKTTRTETTTWTVTWGFYSNASMLQRETFSSRRDAWTRCQEIMALRCSPWAGAPERHVAVLEVWSPRADAPKGHDVCKFNRYEAGSGLCRWGDWGVYTSKTTGECFG